MGQGSVALGVWFFAHSVTRVNLPPRGLLFCQSPSQVNAERTPVGTEIAASFFCVLPSRRTFGFFLFGVIIKFIGAPSVQIFVDTSARVNA